MHTLLETALKTVDPAQHPAAPHHGGVDVNPLLGTFGLAGIAIFLAERVSSYVPSNASGERARFDDFLEIARSIYGKHARAEVRKVGTTRRALSDEELEKLSRKLLGRVRRSDDLPNDDNDDDENQPPLPLSNILVIARDATFAAYDIESQRGGPFTLSLMNDALRRVLGLLPKDELREFLSELDRRLLREELRANLAKRRDPLCARVEACVWRASAERPKTGKGRTGTQIAHWIGRLTNLTNSSHDYIFVWRIGSRWTVRTGSRDEILATVPDEHMESAVNAVFAADSSRGTALVRDTRLSPS